MPSILDQMALPASVTTDFTTARFLLKPGRFYEEAVEAFSPYKEIKDPYPDAQAALTKLLTPEKLGRVQTKYVYVNNRLEGSAIKTIAQALAVNRLEPAPKNDSIFPSLL